MKDSLEQIVSAMTECEGDVSEGWRKSDRFWGKVTLECGFANSDYLRKAMYMLWYKDTDGIKEKFNKRVASRIEENPNESVSDQFEAILCQYMYSR